MTYVRTRSPWRNKEGDHLVWIIVRCMVFAILLMLATWNPTGYSWIGWLQAQEKSDIVGAEALGLWASAFVLAGAWVYSIAVAKKGLRPFTVVLMALLVIGTFAGLQYVVGGGNSLLLFKWVALLGVAALLGWTLSYGERLNAERRLNRRYR